jgi:hypothetical protein
MSNKKNKVNKRKYVWSRQTKKGASGSVNPELNGDLARNSHQKFIDRGLLVEERPNVYKDDGVWSGNK